MRSWEGVDAVCFAGESYGGRGSGFGGRVGGFVNVGGGGEAGEGGGGDILKFEFRSALAIVYEREKHGEVRKVGMDFYFF